MSADLNYSERPNIIPWPPIILVSMILLGLGLGLLFPIREITEPVLSRTHYPGIILFLAGIGLDIWALLTMRHYKTNIAPNSAAEHLVTRGPFCFSRNPIYLGNTMMILGLGLAFNRPWFLVTGILHIFLDLHLAIYREEKHLSLRFGKEWQDYQEKVPRWCLWF